MREIKFRAWSKEKKAFIAGFNMVNFHSYYNAGVEPSIYRYNTKWMLSEIELMQFTGLKDKNGVEIYEGDIVRAANAECVETVAIGDDGYQEIYEDVIGSVVFEDGAFHYNGHSAGNIPLSYNIEDVEVIGNIYSNPELLK